MFVTKCRVAPHEAPLLAHKWDVERRVLCVDDVVMELHMLLQGVLQSVRMSSTTFSLSAFAVGP